VKRLWAYLALGATMISAAAIMASVPASAATPLYGDADGNGTLDLQDVRILARIAGGLSANNATTERAGDVAPLYDYEAGSFGDGKVTLQDAGRLLRKVQGQETGEWPAKPNYYQIQQGNTFTVRKYDATGNPTGAPDVLSTVQAPVQEAVGGVTYIVHPVTGSDGSEQRIVTAKLGSGGQQEPFTDSLGRPALGATRFTFGDTISTFNPPLVVLVYPVENGTTWSGTTQGVISGISAAINYTGTISGPVTVDVPAGRFENAYKVTLAYSGNAGLATATGEEYFWFVPFLGPVQHGFTRTTVSFLGTQVKTVNPDIKLVGADIHGVQYP